MVNQLLTISTFLIASAVAEIPIACNLNALTAGQRKDLHDDTERLANAVINAREMDDGYGFQMDPSKVTVVDLAKCIELWRKCCPFYEFQISLRGEDGSLWLSFSGRKGVKEYFPIDAPKLAARLRHPVAR